MAAIGDNQNPALDNFSYSQQQLQSALQRAKMRDDAAGFQDLTADDMRSVGAQDMTAKPPATALPTPPTAKAAPVAPPRAQVSAAPPASPSTGPAPADPESQAGTPPGALDTPATPQPLYTKSVGDNGEDKYTMIGAPSALPTTQIGRATAAPSAISPQIQQSASDIVARVLGNNDQVGSLASDQMDRANSSARDAAVLQAQINGWLNSGTIGGLIQAQNAMPLLDAANRRTDTLTKAGAMIDSVNNASGKLDALDADNANRYGSASALAGHIYGADKTADWEQARYNMLANRDARDSKTRNRVLALDVFGKHVEDQKKQLAQQLLLAGKDPRRQAAIQSQIDNLDAQYNTRANALFGDGTALSGGASAPLDRSDPRVQKALSSGYSEDQIRQYLSGRK